MQIYEIACYNILPSFMIFGLLLETMIIKTQKTKHLFLF